jgi:hypothetical protein
MTAWTCDRVADELDLYAAGERTTDEQAVETHLKSCVACQANLEASRRLLQMLDLRAAEPARLNRLQALIRQEARQRRRSTVLTLTRRYAALAALLLVAVGLIALPSAPESRLPTSSLGDFLVVSAVVGPGDNRSKVATIQPPGFMKEMRPAALTGDMKTPDDQPIVGIYPLKTDGPAAAVGLTLKLRNTGAVPITVRPRGNQTAVQLDLQGPDVKRLLSTDRAARLALAPASLKLQPGQSEPLTLERLTAGRNGAVESLTWTQPGDYVLSGTLRLEAWSGGQPAGVVEVVIPPVRLRVE